MALARSGFKKPTPERLAELNQKKRERAKLPKPKKKPSKAAKQPSQRILKDKLWNECKRIIRARYANDDGTWNCFTCGRHIDAPHKAQTGHFIASSICGANLRYDLRNLRIQDYFCNINLGGNGAEYYKRLVETEGQEYVDQLFIDKQVSIKTDTSWYLAKTEEYKLL